MLIGEATLLTARQPPHIRAPSSQKTTHLSTPHSICARVPITHHQEPERTAVTCGPAGCRSCTQRGRRRLRRGGRRASARLAQDTQASGH